MKKLVLIILLISCLSKSYSWNGSITLYFIDNVGRIDSVIFGVNEGSTLGIDSTLGEKNIFGIELDSLDVRVIQRDSLNHRCCGYSYSGNAPQNIYFPNNIDSKIDFRPLRGFNTVYNNFEISINAIDYPIIIKAKYNGITGSVSAPWADIYLLDNKCQPSFEQYANPSKDTLTILNDATSTTLMANFQHEVGIENYTEREVDLKIFPNPSNSHLTILSNEILNGTIELLNINGKKMETISIDDRYELNINIMDKPNDIYLVKYSDAKTGRITIKRIIKK